MSSRAEAGSRAAREDNRRAASLAAIEEDSQEATGMAAKGKQVLREPAARVVHLLEVATKAILVSFAEEALLVAHFEAAEGTTLVALHSECPESQL